jgi:hypothetical protein
MRTEAAAFPRQSGAISTVLSALAGFAAGALVMAVLGFMRHPLPLEGEPLAVPMSTGADSAATRTSEVNLERMRPGKADEALTWPFESRTTTRGRDPGANRPDRLSGPDGWTYDSRPEQHRPN